MFDHFQMSPENQDNEFPPLFALSDEEEGTQSEMPSSLPIIALKNTVLFPGTVIPITIGREKSTNAVKKAHEGNKFIGVFAQKDMEVADPSFDDLYNIGVIAKVVKLIKMPDGSTTAILQGRARVQLDFLDQETPFLQGNVTALPDGKIDKELEYDATVSSLKDIARKIIELTPTIPNEAVVMLDNIKKRDFLVNFIASNLNKNVVKKQNILTADKPDDRAKLVLAEVDTELQMLELKKQIEGKVRGGIEKQQRDYFLNQQLKTIQDELGQNPQAEELVNLEKRAKDKKWSEDIGKHFAKELNRAKRLNPQIAEYSVTLSYLEMLLDLPWGEYTKDNFDLKKVEKILNDDHYGLEDVKERILEHLAVLKLKGDMKAPIICLVGPPGVGKTSLGKSISRALNREFIRMSLGGLHDESEIRGHRKTYIGAMPGRIVKSLKKAGSSNPVFLLDEIDKMGKDFRGDPSSALLEVLDPEQNDKFYDNYLELEYDLSKVLFVATANSLNSIQPALLDRMEIIQIAGYSTEEKVEIAQKHLVPKQRKEHGLKANDIKIAKPALTALVENYTKEAGVRSLDRKIAELMRHVAKKVAMEESYEASVKANNLKDMIGAGRFDMAKDNKTETPGVAVGLAWTQVGGDILFIETSLSKGKGKLTLTGNLGDVMKESATTALSYIKSHSDEFNIDSTLFAENDVHIHVPQGAIPKDGPSAGVTIFSALVSAFKQEIITPNLAMTGEITLRGKVLPVGGIKEKILAAKRSGMKKIMLCKDNQKDVEKINPAFIKNVEFIYVEKMSEVYETALA